MTARNDASFLRRGFVLSVLFHALLLLFFADFLALTVTTLPQPDSEPAIQITLLQRASSVSSAVELQPAPNILAVTGVQKGDSHLIYSQVAPQANRLSELIALQPSAANDATGNASEPLTSKGAVEVVEVFPPIPADTLSADDLRQYALSLGRIAKSHKHYPLLAKERGIEGTAVVVISTRAGLAVPQVSLSVSSGAPMLDAQALETVRLAVRDAKIPDGLRNRDFGIDLPIQFSLGD